MPTEFPPQLSTRAKVGVGAVLLLTLAYSFIIAGQILLWFLIAGIAAVIYVAWALVVAVYRMVEALERIADAIAARNADGGERRVGGVESGSDPRAPAGRDADDHDPEAASDAADHGSDPGT